MQNRRRPRALSLTLPNARQPYFVFDGERYLLRNLSETGIGLWVPKERAFGLTPKTQVKGDIVIDRAIHPVTLEVVHSAKGYVGLRILHSDPVLTQVFRNLLEPSNYATDLLPTENSGKDDAGSGYIMFEYSSGPLVTFAFWVGRALDVKSIQIRLLGKWVSRNQFGQIATGTLPETRKPSALTDDETLIIDDTPNSNAVSTASQFLASLPPPLPGAKLWHFLESGEQVFVSESLVAKSAMNPYR